MKIQEKKRTKASILLVYTGGTIGMMQDPNDLTLKPFNFKQILAEAPELGKFAYKIDSYSFNPIIDSSDVEPSLWQKLAWLISTQYSRYDGFVILHGTDTMAYSASALSFMLGNLTKPVIFTGSQLPIGAPRTDGRENLISSVEIAAAKDSDGHALVPEVCICFDNMLMRGNRATKVDSDNFRAFRSVNFPPLAEAGISIRYNTALIRRRIRDPHLVMQMMEIGDSSRTDVALCYMSDRADKALLKNAENRLRSIRTGDLRMNQQSLAEQLFKRKWFNPFPKFKFTERPDTAAACLLEGKVVILVDNSPSAMILPTSILDIIEEANDYYFPTLTGIYLKVTRTLITVATVFFTPLYLLFMQNPQWLPEAFAFVEVRDTVNIPLIFQFLLLELSIDGLRLAAMNTPTMLSTPLSVIAGIVMGEFSVQSGWFNSEVMLYMAFVAVANYTQPNFELGYALKFMRLMLLVLTSVFGLYGFVAGCILVLCFLIFNNTLSGRNYLNVKLN